VKVRFHAYLPTYWDDYGSSSIDLAVTTAARAAAELGYEGVWANDVLLFPSADGLKVAQQQIIEPLVTLASLVHLVPGLTLGTAVVVLPMRDPILVAKQATALHVMSGGRCILGVGIGHRAPEFESVGADFSQRAAVTDEAIEVIQTLWREPTASFHGRFRQFDAVSQAPRPPGHGPPIWIGGNTPAAVRRTARYGSGWLACFIELEELRSRVTLLRELTEGRDLPSIANMFYLRIERRDEPNTVRSTTPWLPTAIAGDADAIAAHIERYADAGLEHALIVFESESVDDLVRQMQVFAEHVAPRLAGSG
jgi:probable F420-dependent oxidoreductase